MKLALILTLAGCAGAQTTLEPARIGRMVDPAGSLRPVSGVAGNFIVGSPLQSRVLGSACGRDVCLAKTDSAVVSDSGAVEAPPGPALISIHDSEAVLYFVESRQLARWRAGQLVILDSSIDGDVLAIRDGPSGVELAVRRDSGVWIVAADNSALSFLTEGGGPVLLLDGAAVYATADQLVLRRDDGSEMRYDAAGVTALFALGEGYVQATARGTIYALKTSAGREQLFVLPQPPAPWRPRP